MFGDTFEGGPAQTLQTTDYGDIVNICDAYGLFNKVGVFIRIQCLRPYHVESTSSRPITEVKQR